MYPHNFLLLIFVSGLIYSLIFKYLDKSRKSYAVAWPIVTLLAGGTCFFIWIATEGWIPSSNSSGSGGGPGAMVNPIYILIIFFIVIPLIVSSFSLLLVLGFFPPTSYGKKARIYLGGFAIVLGGLFTLMVYGNANEHYVKHFGTFEERKTKRRNIIESGKIRDDREVIREPNYEVGPQTKGEWRGIGVFAEFEHSYQTSDYKLKELRYGNESRFAEKSFQMLKFVDELKRLTFQGVDVNERMAGIELNLNCEEVSFLATDLSDSGLKKFLSESDIEKLIISGSAITHKCLEAIKNCETLLYVRLIKTPITEEDLEKFESDTEGEWEFSSNERAFYLRRIPSDEPND